MFSTRDEGPCPMKVLLCFDKFRDCMTAEEACSVAAHAVRTVLPEATVDVVPLSDGGEGFCRILTEAAGGRLERYLVRGPMGERREAFLGFVPVGASKAISGLFPNLSGEGEVAVVEMAQASGLWGLSPESRDPWHATSYGTGQLLDIAAGSGASAILLGIGGSATCDLGLGALEALGLYFMAEDGVVQGVCPADFARLTGISGRLHDLPPMRIACDVQSPLCGPEGAAAVFGPQKGLLTTDVPKLDAVLERVGRKLTAHFDRPASLLSEPSGGAAGGLGLGLRAAFGASFILGADLVWRWMDLDRRIRQADIILTGEGCFDAGSKAGKGPYRAAQQAARYGKKVFLFAGQVLSEAAAGEPFRCVQLAPAKMPLEESLREGHSMLADAVRRLLGDELL